MANIISGSAIRFGAIPVATGGVRFCLWAPTAERVDLVMEDCEPLPMEERSGGCWSLMVPDARPGTRYRFRLDGEGTWPDPASRFQPEGIHGPSEVVATNFPWTDQAWRGIGLPRCVFYELHVGTFTEEGTFDGAIGHLGELAGLGITAVEIMPVAQFPGSRNWGYDGACPFAVQNSYGGPEGLKRLVDACHAAGLAVFLDVVYNHLGPEGNYLGLYAPYFTDRYATPWGQAVNFDGPDSDGVREYFLQNAERWVDEFHFDGLRLDAVHAIYDFSAKPFLEELKERVAAVAARTDRRIHVVAESDLNDTRLIRTVSEGGMGLDAQWSDDFHHSLHALLTGEREGYYEDFGTVEHFARAWKSAFVYAGDYSGHRKRRHGNATAGVPAERFVVCIQNHDQVGNRATGDRIGPLAGFEKEKLAAVALVLARHLPLLFMGQEYGETAPFLYFVDHEDPELLKAVREGRRREFAAFHGGSEVPDPGAAETFLRSKLQRHLRTQGRHGELLALYRRLLALRRDHAILSLAGTADEEVRTEGQVMTVIRRWRGGAAAICLNFSDAAAPLPMLPGDGRWRVVLVSAGGCAPGSLLPDDLEPWSALVAERIED